MTEMIQRAGRAVRDPDSTGLFLAMVEMWAFELELQVDARDIADPDKPYAGMVKKNSPKQDRTSIASLQFVQSHTCLHKVIAEYLGKISPDGNVAIGILLRFTDILQHCDSQPRGVATTMRATTLTLHHFSMVSY